MNKKQIVEKLNSEYSSKRFNAEATANQNLNLARQDEEFEKNYEEIKSLEFEIAKCEFEKKDSSDLKDKMQELKFKEKSILKRLKISPLALTPNYSCKTCKDTGYVNGKRCLCFKNRYQEELIKLGGFEQVRLTTFTDFNDNIAKDPKQKEYMLKAKNKLQQYIEKYPYSELCNIILSGPTGVGKTFMAECFASEIIKRGYTVCFITAFQMNNQFLKYHTCFDATKQSYLELMIEPDLLILDDLGTEPKLKNVTDEYLYLVISERMLKHKTTFITTNLTFDGIRDRYGERIGSRLFNKLKVFPIKLYGEDLRLN